MEKIRITVAQIEKLHKNKKRISQNKGQSHW